MLGCGRAARVVLRWLVEAGQIQVGQVCNRSRSSSSTAVDYIGQGVAVDNLSDFSTRDWLLLGLPDSSLASGADSLRTSLHPLPFLAFHLSGSVRSDVLQGLTSRIASVHPACAFARPENALPAMSRTWFTAEGQADAMAELKPRFESAGGSWQQINPNAKVIYHAATVVASNYLVVLTGLARDLAATAGLDEVAAATLLENLQRSTLDNLRAHSSSKALTGPIERGDLRACQRLVEQVDCCQPDQAILFRELSLGALKLAIRARGPRESDIALEQLFTNRAD